MPKRPHRHLLLLILGLALFTGLAVTSHLALTSVQRSTAERAMTRSGLITLVKLSSAMSDIEGGQRGYLLTGDPVYLRPYEAAIAGHRALIADLRRQVAHLPSGRMLEVERGAALMAHRIALARKNVEARQRGRPLSTAPGSSIDRGRIAGERTRAWIGEMEQRLEVEIDLLDARVQRISRTSLVTEALLGSFGVASIVVAVFLLNREHVRRLDAEFELHRANFALEERVRERTAELEDARGTLERFAIHLDQGIEAERRRLAREVHDQLGQVFTALRLSWGTIAQRHAIAGVDRERIDQLVMDGLQTARRISAELRPPLLDEFGLADAVAHRAEGFRDETGIDCEVDMDGTDELDREQATQLFRIVQEALTNVARHSGARIARVRGERVESNYELVVEDDGRGLRSPRHGSHGLPNMRERAALAGGELRMDSPPAGGLRVHVSVPLTGRCA